MNQRRRLLAFLAFTPAAAWPQPAAGQYRIALLSAGFSPSDKSHPSWPAFFDRMRALGYEEGRNVTYDMRNAAGTSEQVPKMARELVAGRPHLIVVTGSTEAVAVSEVTSSIPIVMMHGSYDPVRLGLAASLARPGRNLTGMISTIDGFSEKALELLIEAIPTAKRISVLGNPSAAHYPEFRKELERVAAAKGIALLPTAEAARPEELEAAFGRIVKERPQAAMIHHDALFWIHRRRIIAFAAQTRLPVMYRFTEDVEAGGLMAFATEYRALYARAPVFVDKILKGAKPGDIPIEQPTRFGLWINLKTARELGLKIPSAVLARAERVIE